MNKLILKSELDLDFILIAITSVLKDYRMCFKINKQLQFQFYRTDELSLSKTDSKPPTLFSTYQYQLEQSETDMYLIANKGSDAFLVPEMKQADFFILIKNYIDDEDLQQLLINLNKIPDVSVAIQVNPKKLKSKENLIF